MAAVAQPMPAPQQMPPPSALSPYGIGQGPVPGNDQSALAPFNLGASSPNLGAYGQQVQVTTPTFHQDSSIVQDAMRMMGPQGQLSIPTQQPQAPKYPTLNQAWAQHAAGIKDHAPTRADFDAFAQQYEQQHVDPTITSIPKIKNPQIQAYKAQFQTMAGQLGDQLFPAAKKSAASSLGESIADLGKGLGGGAMSTLATIDKLLGGATDAVGGLFGHPDIADGFLDRARQLGDIGQDWTQSAAQRSPWMGNIGSFVGNIPAYIASGGQVGALQNAFGNAERGDNLGDIYKQYAVDAPIQALLAAVGADEVGAGGQGAAGALAKLQKALNLGRKGAVGQAIGSAVTGTAANAANQALDTAVNPNNEQNPLNPQELGRQAVVQAAMSLLTHGMSRNPLKGKTPPPEAQPTDNTQTPPPAAQANSNIPPGAKVLGTMVDGSTVVQTDSGIQVVPAAKQSVTAPDGSIIIHGSSTPQAQFQAAVNNNADANGVSAQAHAAAMQNFTKTLNGLGKSKNMKALLDTVKTPEGAVEAGLGLARIHIPDDTWNTFSADQRQAAIEQAASFIAKKNGIDAAQIANTIQQYAKPPEAQPAPAAGSGTTAPEATPAQAQPAAAPPAAAAPAPAVQETPLPADVSGTQVPGTAPQANPAISELSGGGLTGTDIPADAQKLYNVVTGKEQNPDLHMSRIGQVVSKLVQDGHATSPADIETFLSTLAGKAPETKPTPAAAQPRNALKAKTNAQQAAEHDNTANVVTEALSTPSTTDAAKNVLKARVRKNAEQKYNEQYMQAALNGGPSTGAAEDAVRADPHFMAVKQALADGRISTPEQLGAFLKNERDVAEQATQTPPPTAKKSKLAKPKATSPAEAATESKPLKKGASKRPKAEAPAANAGAVTELEQQLRNRFSDSLPQNVIDQLHDAVAMARQGDSRDLGDLIEGWRSTDDLSSEDAKWLKQQAKQGVVATPKAAKPAKSLQDDLAEARANEGEPNDGYLNDQYHQNNASGESSASLEAQNRLKDEQAKGQVRAIIRQSGEVERLHGVDAVDTHARKGEVVVQHGIGKEPWTILSHGDDLSRDVATGKINRARAELDKLHNTVPPVREVDVPGFGKVKFNQEYNVELLGGSSRDGKMVYAHKGWNPLTELRNLKTGKMEMVDRSPFLAIHELVERELEDKGNGYGTSHYQAEREEDAAVRAAGYDPKSYQDSYTHEIADAARDTKGDTPPDLVAKPYEHPHSVRAREALNDVEDHEDGFGPHGEYMLHIDDLEDAQEKRNQLSKGTEKEPDRIAPLQTKRRVGEILNRVRQGADIHETGQELQKLRDDIDTARMQQKLKESIRPLQRGTEYVRARLQKMIAEHEPGDEHYEAGKFGQWLLEQNPNLGNYLAIRIHDMGEKGAAGRFSPAARLLGINSKATNPGTVVHEIMHSAEQLMPDWLQNKIRGEYIGRLQNKLKQVIKSGNKDGERFIQLAIENHAHPSLEAQREMSLLMKTSKNLPYDEFYKYTNPSEYWAVESTDMLNNRWVKTGFAERAKQWLSGFFQHVKSLLGLDSNHAVAKGLDSILKSPGEDYNEKMLATPRGEGEGPTELHDIQKEDEDDSRNSAAAETRGFTGIVNHAIENLANAHVAVERSMQGLRRSGVEITPDNNVDDAISLARGLHSDYNMADGYTHFKPFQDWVNKNFRRFGNDMDDALDNITKFFQNTHWIERAKSLWAEEAPLNSAMNELKRAKLFDDMDEGKAGAKEYQSLMNSVKGDYKYDWQQWARNHDVPVQVLTDKLQELKTKFGIDEQSMADLNKIMDGARQQSIARRIASGDVAKDDPWIKARDWKWYVPLKSGKKDMPFWAHSYGNRMTLAQLSSSLKAMQGRSTFAESPVMQLYSDMAGAGKDQANSHIGNTLYNLATDPKAAKALGADIDTWEGTPHGGYTNETTGTYTAQLKAKPNEVIVHDGRTHYVISFPEDSQMARGLWKVNNIAPVDPFGKRVQRLTNGLARIRTTLSPAWMTFTAFARDYTYVPAVIGVTHFDNPLEAVPFFTRYSLNAVKSMAAIKELPARLTGNLGALEAMAKADPDSWAAWTVRYMRQGGNNEFVGAFSPSALKGKLGSESLAGLPKSADGVINATKQGFGKLYDLTNRYADWATMIPRIAAFRTGVEMGWDERYAAAQARRVLDYAESGVQGRRINAYKAFFRVGMTSVDAMRRAFQKPTGGMNWPKLAKWMTFFTAIGVARSAVSNMLLGQDDDGKDKMAKMLPETIATSLLLPVGDQVAGWQTGLGLPQIMMAPGALMYGYNAGYYSLQDAADAYGALLGHNLTMESGGTTGHDPASFIGALAKGMITGGTVAEPVMDIANNVDHWGVPIHGDARKGHFASDSGRPSTPDDFKSMAQELNTMTNGEVDMYPEEIEYIMQQYGGQWASELISQMQSQSPNIKHALPIPGVVKDQDFYLQRELYSTLDQLDNANKRYNAIVDHAKEQGMTDDQAKMQAQLAVSRDPDMARQMQLYKTLQSAAGQRGAAMKQLQANKFTSQTGRELQQKRIDSQLRQTLDNVSAQMH